MKEEHLKPILELLDTHFTSSEGIIYGLLDRETRRPADEHTFRGATPLSDLKGTDMREWYVEGYTRPELAAHENSGMATGAALTAAVMAYRRTGDEEALKRARKLFGGVKRICEVGATYEPGFITKYYGARFTYETSNDQCLYLTWGMDTYREVATDEEKAFIARQIPAIVDFWMRHNYTYTYFQLKDMRWPPLRFPALLALAYEYTGDDKYLKASEEIMADNIDCVPEFAAIPRYRNRRYSDYEEEHDIRYLHGMADCVTMDTMHLTLLLRCLPESRFAPQWRKGIETIWDEARRVLTPDGKCLTLAFYQMKDGQTVKPYADSPLPWARTAWSTMIARAGLQGLPHMPHRRGEIIGAAKRVLEALGPDDLIYYEDLHGFPETRRFLERFLSGDAIANWLWAYELLQLCQGSADK